MAWPRFQTAGAIVSGGVDLIPWLASLAMALILALGRYVLLGMMLASWARRSISAAAKCLVAGSAMVVTTESADAWLASQAPMNESFVLGSIGFVLGLLIGVPWSAGRRRLTWAVIGVGIVASIATGTLLISRAIVTDLPAIQMAKVTSDDKRRISDMLYKNRDKNPDAPDRAEIRFTWHDLRAMIAWGCEVVAPTARGDLKSLNEGVQIVGAVPLFRDRFLTGSVTAMVEGDEHGLAVRWHAASVGDLEIPAFAATLCNPVGMRLIRQDSLGDRFLGALIDLRSDEDGIALAYSRAQMPDEYFAHLTGALDNPEPIAGTQYYIGFILKVSTTTPRNDQGFAAIYSAVFSEALRRSAEHDPVTENKAAILGLAVTLGHRSLAKFIGPVITPDNKAGFQTIQRPRLKRRVDWSRHFSLSAGLAVLSSEGISDAVGLLKEVRDAGEGGSGFSFTDLAADRAGTRFGTLATATPENARRYQDMLAGPFDTGILCPELWDIPEGLKAAEFEARYGEVGSPAYQKVIDEIESRLDAIPALN